MRRLILTAALLAATLASLPAVAASRRAHPRFCTPVYIEGAGTVLMCAPGRKR